MQERRSPFSDHQSKRKRLDDDVALLLMALDPLYGAKLLPTNYLPLFHRRHNLTVREMAGELARRPIGDTCPTHIHTDECDKANKDLDERLPCECPKFKCPHKLLDFVQFSVKNPSAVRYYFRTPAGDRFLKERGYIASMRRPPGKNMHQAMVDVWKARLRYGLKSSTLRFNDWPALLKRPTMPESTKTSEHPFRLYLGKDYIVPDDAPFSLGNDAEGGWLFLFEMDCNTEDLAYSKDRNTIEGKLLAYRDRLKAHVPERLYGVKHGAVRLVIETTTEARRTAIVRRIGDVLGPRHDILVGVTENYPKLGTTPPANTHSLTQRYKRAGHPDFSLETLREV